MAKSDVPPPAANLFADYLRRLDAGEQVDFEALCRAHPTLATWLRRQEATRGMLEQLLPPPLAEEHAAATRGDASASDAEGSVAFDLGTGGSADNSAGPTSDLLRRLAQKPPSAGRYELLGEIARGGMGIVWHVLDTELRRRLAMKVVRGKGEGAGAVPATDSSTTARFLEEAQITSQLDHPGIVPLHEIGLDADGRLFFTMRLVRGITLREVFERVASGDPEWPQVRAVGVLLKVCEAMSYAHDKKVVHRDLKPANVMVGKFGEVYVMDWGLARVLGRYDPHDLRLRQATGEASAIHTERGEPEGATPDSPLVTMDGQVIGTPAYMAPEQAQGLAEHVGAKADVYAIGAMLYHLIAGQMPYVPPGARMSSQAVCWRVAEGPPRPLHEFGRVAPPALVAICEKAMQRDLARRYGDMRALADDLRRYGEGRVVAAYETGAWAETRMWVRRNKGFAAMSAAAVAAVVVTCGFLLFSYLDSSRWARIQAWARDVQELTKAGADLRQAKASGYPTQAHWGERARLLVGIRPVVEDELTALRNGKQWTQAHFDEAWSRFSRRAELEAKRQDVIWRTRMRSKQWPTDAETQASFEMRTREVKDAAGVEALNKEVFSVVRPDHERPIGYEAIAVRLAGYMVEKAKELGCYRPALRDTLAFALFRVGDFDGAIEEQQTALQEQENLVKEMEVEVPQREATMAKASEEALAELRTSREPIGFLRDNLELLRGFRTQWADPALQERILDRLKEDVDDLEWAVEADAWSIALGTEAWRHDEVVRLLSDLRRLARRLREAADAKRTFGWSDRWHEALESLRQSSVYPKSMVLTPQEDLLPLGMDNDSKLLEFAHLPSGEPALPNGDNYRFEPHTGMVFVLVPGGKIPRPAGAPALPVYAVELAPFFLSKYEMTGPQWLRLSGEWRPEYTVESRYKVLPVGGVAWQECNAFLAGAGGWLHLPTGAQWEYACRANQEIGYWPLNAELFEQCSLLERVGDTWVEGRRDQAVGLPNRFGLYDMIGLVAEWCADGPDDGLMPLRGDGRRDSGSTRRWLRGGSNGTRPLEVSVGHVAKSARTDWPIGHSHLDVDGDGDLDFFGEEYMWTIDDRIGLRPARPVLK